MVSVGQLPLIVLVGPTASGKTALAISLAKKFGGEIICADSRTVYKGMDIGTAKPTRAEREEVPHWGLDLVGPHQSFSAADFKQYAVQKIAEIRIRGNVPFLVGGTGLYIDAVLFDYKFGSKADPELRQKLEVMSLSALHHYCFINNISLPENNKNKRYVIRAIERNGEFISRLSRPISHSVVVGISTEREMLRKRIVMRTDYIFKNNVVDEAISLAKQYGWTSEAMTGNIYRIIRSYIDGTLSLEQSKEKFTTSDWHLAKRQMTWLRRNPNIMWLSLEEAESYLSRLLASE